jgi:hypothetical protein
MDGWLSDSRQALIFSRRQTQHRASVEKGATAPPQITHFPRLIVLCGRIARVLGATIGSPVASAGMTPVFFRFMVFLAAQPLPLVNSSVGSKSIGDGTIPETGPRP